MLEVPLFSASGVRSSASCALPADYYDGTVNEPVLHQAVKTYLGNQRQGTAATKTRSMVSGGGAKPWRQKGTGRARQGTIRAAQWRGGGVVFGPSPRDYRTGIPTKVRRLARRSALNARVREGAFFAVDGFAFERPKTSALLELLTKIGVEGRKTLILTDGINRTAYLSGRNLPRVRVMPYREAAAYHVLWAEVVVVERAAVDDAGDASGPEKPTPRARPEGGKTPAAGSIESSVKKTVRRAAKKAVKKAAKKAAPKAPTVKDDE